MTYNATPALGRANTGHDMSMLAGTQRTSGVAATQLQQAPTTELPSPPPLPQPPQRTSACGAQGALEARTDTSGSLAGLLLPCPPDGGGPDITPASGGVRDGSAAAMDGLAGSSGQLDLRSALSSSGQVGLGSAFTSNLSGLPQVPWSPALSRAATPGPTSSQLPYTLAEPPSSLLWPMASSTLSTLPSAPLEHSPLCPSLPGHAPERSTDPVAAAAAGHPHIPSRLHPLLRCLSQQCLPTATTALPLKRSLSNSGILTQLQRQNLEASGWRRPPLPPPQQQLWRGSVSARKEAWASLGQSPHAMPGASPVGDGHASKETPALPEGNLSFQLRTSPSASGVAAVAASPAAWPSTSAAGATPAGDGPVVMGAPALRGGMSLPQVLGFTPGPVAAAAAAPHRIQSQHIASDLAAPSLLAQRSPSRVAALQRQARRAKGGSLTETGSATAEAARASSKWEQACAATAEAACAGSKWEQACAATAEAACAGSTWGQAYTALTGAGKGVKPVP